MQNLYEHIGRQQVALEQVTANHEELKKQYRNLLAALDRVQRGEVKPEQLVVDQEKLSWEIIKEE